MKIFSFLFALVLSLGIGLPGAQAQPLVELSEGDQVSDGVTIKHGFRNNRSSVFPLPPGQWVVRHKDLVKSTHANPQPGLAIWLEKVDKKRIEQLLTLTIYETQQLSWSPNNACNVGVMSPPRGTALSGGCYSLLGGTFMTDPKSAIQDKARKAWTSQQTQFDPASLLFRGMVDAVGGAVVYFSLHTPFSPIAPLPLSSFLNRFRAGEALPPDEAALATWYASYGKSIVDAITGSAKPLALAEFPKLAKDQLLGLTGTAVAANKTGPAAGPNPPGAAPDAAAQKERDRLAAELEAERKRRQEAEQALQAREQERAEAEKRRLAEQQRQEEARLAQLKRDQERLDRERRDQTALAGRADEEKRLAAIRAQEQQKAQEAATQRDAKLAAELRELREQIQRMAMAPAASASAAPPVAQPAPAPAAPASNARRMALVIGNDGYQAVPSLLNARSDARAMAKSLEAAGFKVSLKLDLTERSMKEALRSFRQEVQGGDEVVVFFAGHGVQLGAANYLLPIDIRGDSEEQVRDEAIPLQRILDDLSERKARFSLAIIDACRDNPFKTAGRAIGGRGLAPATAASGQMVIFSAGSGQQALDRLGEKDKEPNGLFTRIFLKEMSRPGVSIDRVVRNVRNEVVLKAKSIGHEQVPALYDQTLGDFYFMR